MEVKKLGDDVYAEHIAVVPGKFSVFIIPPA